MSEREAYGKIYSKFHPDILNFATYVLSDRLEAEDIAQDIFVEAFRWLKTYDLTERLKKWLIMATHRRCLDRLKKQWAAKKYRHRVFEFANLNRTGSQMERTIDGLRLIESHLSELTSQERRALYFIGYEGCSAAEFATAHDCAESTARVILFRAKKKLRERRESSSVRLKALRS